MTHAHSTANRLRELALDALALALPVDCAGCGRSDRLLCRGCRRVLDRLARAAPAGQEELALADGAPQSVPLVSGCVYAGAARRIMVAFKHGGQPALAKPLAPLLRATLRAALAPPEVRAQLAPAGQLGADAPIHPGAGAPIYPGGDAPIHPDLPVVCVPVPSRPERVRSRGYHHVELLLRHAGVPRSAVCRLLRTTRGRTTQVGHDPQQRAVNAARLRVRPRPRDRLLRERVAAVIVDDICTTGASLSAAARAVHAAGIPVLAAVAVCRAERRDARNPREAAKK